MREKKDLILYGAICIAALFLIFHYWDNAIAWLGTFLNAVKPLLVGCAAAYILNLIMSFYERALVGRWNIKSSVKRAFSIILSLVTLLLILALIINMVLPELKSCGEILISSIPAAYEQVMDFLNSYPEIMALIPFNPESQIDIQKLLNQFVTFMSSGAGASLFGYISSVVSVIFNLFVALIFSIYVLAGKEWLGRQTDRIFRTYIGDGPRRERFYHVLKTLDNSFHRFIVGQCTEAVILGTLCALGMLIFRFPYAVMIGILIGATALIPIFGAYIGGVIGFILIFTESPVKSVLFVVFLIILQQLENQLIYPRVVGSSIGLPGIFVFSAVMVGGSLFGVLGVLLGIPLTAAVYQLVKEDLKKREGK